MFEILKLMFDQDSEDEIWPGFVFELVIWTQPSGPLCLWQCLFECSWISEDANNQTKIILIICWHKCGILVIEYFDTVWLSPSKFYPQLIFFLNYSVPEHKYLEVRQLQNSPILKSNQKILIKINATFRLHEWIYVYVNLEVRILNIF